jgi:hypothetical protein
MTDVVQKLLGFCHTLRYDEIDYAVTTLGRPYTLKMVGEASAVSAPLNR